MIEIALFYKKTGQTLGEQKEIVEKKWQNKNLTYAGRLDPMAKGLVAWLDGNDQRNKEYLQKLSKTYEFELILGLQTDSFDPLGILKNHESVTEEKKISSDSWLQNNFLGKHEQPFPPFSSRKVAGKPLFDWTRNNKSPIDWPKKEIEILEINIIEKTKFLKTKDWFLEIKPIISNIKGDFRQKEILNCWEDFIKKHPEHFISTTTLRVKASSGTYVRWLATKIGEKLGVPSLANNINRLKIGDFFLPTNQKYGFFCFDSCVQKQ